MVSSIIGLIVLLLAILVILSALSYWCGRGLLGFFISVHLFDALGKCLVAAGYCIAALITAASGD